jgi:hypothetical protein
LRLALAKRTAAGDVGHGGTGRRVQERHGGRRRQRSGTVGVARHRAVLKHGQKF